MERIIIFRGIRSYSEEWIYGDLLNMGECYHIIERDYASVDEHNLILKNDKPTEVMENTIGQFCGLFDKNGKEIYDGDIVMKLNKYFICKWSESFACFVFIENSEYGVYNYFQECDEKEITVVGNIYDNSYLVKYDFIKDNHLKKSCK